MPKVTILGCGPSGLLAAHAFVREGWKVEIVSKKQPSKIGGAQYLHRAIPGVTLPEPEGQVTYQKLGTRDGYAEKVYGDVHQEVSWDLYDEGNYPIWSLRGVYRRLWDLYEPFIQNVALEQRDIKALSGMGLVISSIPAKALCDQAHTFRYQKIIVIQKTTQQAHLPENVIQYNGNPETGFYRFSRIFGVEGWEFANPSAAEYDDAIPINKPISTDCNCQPHVLRVGRYGKWEKKQLTHHAFEEALEIARAM